MIAVAASRLGLHVHAYDPDPLAPAAEVCARSTCAAWDDAAALAAFAASVRRRHLRVRERPPRLARRVEALVPIRPGRRALATSRDRLTEKAFLRGLGLGTAPFAAVDDQGSLRAALAEVGLPAILKTRTLGYDGKGQARVASRGEAEAALGGARRRARDARGARGVRPRGLGDRRAGPRRRGRRLRPRRERPRGRHPADHHAFPRRLAPAQRTDAVLAAARILTALDYVGVMGVELFVTRSGLLVNEIAPRVHNSGHWTEARLPDGPVRAARPRRRGLAARRRRAPCRRGDGEPDRRRRRPPPRARSPRARSVHLYGKAEARPGRKMGHVNRLLRR